MTTDGQSGPVHKKSWLFQAPGRSRKFLNGLRKRNVFLLSSGELTILRDQWKDRFEQQARDWLETLNTTDAKKRDTMNLNSGSIVWTASDSDSGLATHIAKRHNAESQEIGSKFLPSLTDQALQRFMLIGEIRLLEDLTEQMRKKPDIAGLNGMGAVTMIKTGQPVGIDALVAASGVETVTAVNALEGIVKNKLVVIKAGDIEHLKSEHITCIGRISVSKNGAVRAAMVTCHPGSYLPQNGNQKDEIALATTPEEWAHYAQKHGIAMPINVTPVSRKKLKKAARGIGKILLHFAADKLPLPKKQQPPSLSGRNSRPSTSTFRLT